MARPLAPCGTPAAYRRHRRRGEPVDDACAAAAREQKNSRVRGKREKVAAVVAIAVTEAPADDAPIDELAEARDTLRMVTAAMKAGAPGLASLAKQRMELVAQIRKLEGAARPKESKLDELARRRAERLAASAH
ncbi:MAG: hypothetical protein B7X41_12710 [Microbacterium sp. 14-71-5]|nr:MAG: hypothetical protein B7X41_12710 [Microbacterium sp. 14-71-5]